MRVSQFGRSPCGRGFTPPVPELSEGTYATVWLLGGEISGSHGGTDSTERGLASRPSSCVFRRSCSSVCKTIGSNVSVTRRQPHRSRGSASKSCRSKKAPAVRRGDSGPHQPPRVGDAGITGESRRGDVLARVAIVRSPGSGDRSHKRRLGG